MTAGGAPTGTSTPDVHPATFGRTDFEGFGHDQLLGMIRHADPEALACVGDQLGLAVETIARIGTELHRHTTGIAWEGASGTAFREWGRSVAGATLGLSDCARSTAAALTHAADTLRAVARDMPLVPVAARSTCAALQADPTTRNDPDAATLLARAHAEVEAARLEAADQMRKLAQSYSLSATVIATVEPPEYPPMPSRFVPPTRTRPSGTGRRGGLPPAQGRPASVVGRGAGADAAVAVSSPEAGSGAEAPPVTRMQSMEASAQPGVGAGGAYGGGPHAGPPAAHTEVPQLFAGAPLPYASPRDFGAHGTAGQLPRIIPRQTAPRIPYESTPELSPAREGLERGITGGSRIGGPPILGGTAQGPAAYGVVGSYGPALRPPVGWTAGSDRAAVGGGGERRLAGEPGGWWAALALPRSRPVHPTPRASPHRVPTPPTKDVPLAMTSCPRSSSDGGTMTRRSDSGLRGEPTARAECRVEGAGRGVDKVSTQGNHPRRNAHDARTGR